MPRPSIAFFNERSHYVEVPILPFTVDKVAEDRLWTEGSWTQRGNVLTMDEAERYYTRYLELFPNSSEGYYRRSIVHSHFGRTDEAEADFRKAVENGHDAALLYNRRVQTQRRQLEQDTVLSAPERIDRMLEIQRQLVETLPDDTHHSLSLAIHLHWFGRDEQHRSLCRELLAAAIAGNDPFACDRAAKAFLIRPDAGDDEELFPRAVTAARRAVEQGQQSPNLPWFQLAAGIAAYRLDDYTEAATLLTGAQQSDDVRIRGAALFFRAMASHAQGHFDEAAEDFTKAEHDMPPMPDRSNVPATIPDHDALVQWLAYAEASIRLHREDQQQDAR